MRTNAVMFTDTHVHFDVFHENGGIEPVIARAREAGVRRMLAIGGSAAANLLALRIAREHPDELRAAVGYDREVCLSGPDISALKALVDDPFAVAVGETGLDYHYHPETGNAQRDLFARMLEMAGEHGLPAVIHSREAEEDTLNLLDRNPGLKGALHCFTGTVEFARELLKRGICISFSGIVTFGNAAGPAAAAALVPEDMILAETDAPYLAPVPHRGKRNEPAFVVETVRKLAQIRNCSVEQMAAITSRNAARLFGWRVSESGE